MSEERSDAGRILFEQVIAPLVGLAVMYWAGTHAASIEIELRSRWARLKAATSAARTGYDSGRRVAEWFVRQEAPKVIEAAEGLTRSAAGGSSPEPSDSLPEREGER